MSNVIERTARVADEAMTRAWTDEDGYLQAPEAIARALAAAGLLAPECDCDAPLTHLAEEIPDECPAHPRSDLRAVRAATLVPTTARNRKYSEGYAQAMADIRAACAAIDIYGPAHYLEADRG